MSIRDVRLDIELDYDDWDGLFINVLRHTLLDFMLSMKHESSSSGSVTLANRHNAKIKWDVNHHFKEEVKPMANNPYEYECYDNDNHIRIYAVNGEIDEIHFSDPLKKDWLIIGYGDLEAAIRNAQDILDRTV